MFAGKTWWITGASSGIGQALADALAKDGAKLILSGRNVAALNDVAESTNAETLVLPFEATDYARVPALVEEAWNWGGRIDGLVNNAGISQRSLAIDTVFEVYQKIIAVDLLAPIALTQALLPRMAGAGGGHIVAISSVAGIAGPPLRSAYSAAKAGLIGYHDSVRAETSHLGMKVLVVAPGSVKTNVSKNALDANAETRGFSDSVIDNGMAPEVAVARIIEALRNDQRELILADGMEAEIARLRRADPDKLFDLMTQLVAGGYAKQLGAEKS
ncbi:SDR family NAD(P)-dependent oxidoreductase [Candidatus Viadribacter manganicus]|uniref:Short-chain dehydrogenase n=1 Tax=Candidatus Viadribacter manganicus TaxID=1759059 RepID=A0A1B1AFM1_9PROT|nr:SDR family NAD(P)-dependent oxidoreductase [Candidatus Viadribacter manganicus]ANP45352.1 short-chain dehydrogenase [Candidatus Viadribacter manganicus]